MIANLNFYDGVIAAIKAIEESQPPETTPWACVDAIKKKLLPDYDQPTLGALRHALNEVYACRGFKPSEMAAVSELRILRNRRHTWCGPEENEVRFAIDRLMDEYRT